jgi:hypothetical protein
VEGAGARARLTALPVLRAPRGREAVAAVARRVRWFPAILNRRQVQEVEAARASLLGPAFHAAHRGPLAP